MELISLINEGAELLWVGMALKYVHPTSESLRLHKSLLLCVADGFSSLWSCGLAIIQYSQGFPLYEVRTPLVAALS